MKKLYLVPMDCPGLESVNVWVDEKGVATHNVISGTWPVMCMGIKINYSEVKREMKVSQEEYDQTQAAIMAAQESITKRTREEQDIADEHATMFFHDYIDHQNKVFHRGMYGKK